MQKTNQFSFYEYQIVLKKTNYTLGKTGRNNLNIKIYNKKYFSKKKTLIPEDILGSLNYLINTKNKFEFKT